jgi:hypothetical protein
LPLSFYRRESDDGAEEEVNCPRCNQPVGSFSIEKVVGMASAVDIDLWPCRHIIGREHKDWDHVLGLAAKELGMEVKG